MSTRIAAPAVAALLVALALAACANSDAAPPDEDPHIRGVINELSAGGDDLLGSILVEGLIEEDTTYDKASVRITEDTDIFRESGGGLVEVTFGDLQLGQAVEVWFTGPVAESYPVQATAGAIVILEDAPAD